MRRALFTGRTSTTSLTPYLIPRARCAPKRAFIAARLMGRPLPPFFITSLLLGQQSTLTTVTHVPSWRLAPFFGAEPAAKPKRAAKDKTAATRGNLRVPLTDNNILHRDWALKLKSKYNLPVFCGRRPDRCPPCIDPELRDQDWQNCADQFAQRMLVLFSPWLTEHHIRNPDLLKELMPASDTSEPFLHDRINLYVPIALIDTCEEDQTRTDWDRLMDFMQAGEQTFIGRCKNRVIQNLADNLASSANTESSRAILMKFRARCATVWNAKDKADPSLVDKNIGKRVYARAYNLVNEENAAVAAKEDDELQQQVQEFQAMCDGSDLQPSLWAQHEIAYVAEQTAGFERVYGVDPTQPASAWFPQRRQIDSITQDHLGNHDSKYDSIMDKLKNKHEIKTAPPLYVANPVAACPAGVTPNKSKDNVPNADQQHAIKLIEPLIESYQLFNANPMAQEPVIARHFFITGGPGTGMVTVKNKPHHVYVASYFISSNVFVFIDTLQEKLSFTNKLRHAVGPLMSNI
jgi:hypothetical protein